LGFLHENVVEKSYFNTLLTVQQKNMGKPFAAELTRVVDTLAWVQALDISQAADFFARANGSPLVTIGAGGSFTTAEMARLLFESRGGIGIVHTPLSFLQNRSNLRDMNILLFTASGNNRDVLAIFDAAVEREAKTIFVVCGSARSKIGLKVAGCSQAKLFTMPLLTKKDGYLATNSLAAFSAMTIRAFGHALPSPKTIDQIITMPDEKWCQKTIKPISPFHLALYGDWARPAAVDLESKFSEAGLGGVMLADYRNFAHGRHNWIDKRGEESTVIAFITPESAALAERTLQLLPSTTRVLEFKTKTPGPAGGLELILHAFRYTAFVGKQRGIDPGRPGVPAYGSRIFHLGPVVYTKCRRASNLAQQQAAAVNRKQAARGTLDDEDDRSRVTQAFATYSARLQEAKFGSLVVDFDGTVVGSGATNGPLPPAIIAFFTKLLKRHVTIYFATGRGDSIHCILQASFPSSLWDRLYISYYNGVLTLPFTESSSFDEGNLPANPALDLVFKIMQQDSLLTKLTKLNRANHKHCQIAIKVAASSSVSVVSALVRDIVAENACTALRVVQSSHSIDVIPAERTKLACVELAQNRLQSSYQVLTIGDRGAMPGNDFDLLTHPFSLSVDTVSTALDSCWNFLPPGVRNTPGLACYASWIRAQDGRFTIALPRNSRS
jgi:hypothetical protein